MVTPEAALSRWTMPILRIGMGVFLVLWGLDKWLAVEDSIGIFSHFYGLDVGALPIRLFGAGEILLGIALAVGILPKITAWLQFIVNGISSGASWKEILDPWGALGLTEGGTHLF